MTRREEYVKEYYESCMGEGQVDKEVEAVGLFLADNVKGKVLDCGCGPVPQVWAICMPDATEIAAIDLPQESIDFVKRKLVEKKDWYMKFYPYQKLIESAKGNLSSSYILNQVDKVKTVQQADMTKNIPFEDGHFDTVVSLYSLGVLRNEEELDNAIINMARVLKKGGKLLHVNTDGKNANSILPEYTWRGLPQASEILTPFLEKHGFSSITIKKVPLKDYEGERMYKYDAISLLSAVKS